jgi:hypothetical protein
VSRRLVVALAAALLGLAMVPPAGAVDIDRFAVPLPREATITLDACPYVGGACADTEAGRVYLAGDLDLFELAHELGHVYFERDLPARFGLQGAGYWRGRVSILLGHHPYSVPWDGLHGDGLLTGDECTDRPCPAEQAADAYAACALRMRPEGRRVGRRIVGGWQTAYGYHPTPRQHRRICDVIRASGGVQANGS